MKVTGNAFRAASGEGIAVCPKWLFLAAFESKDFIGTMLSECCRVNQ